MEMEIIVGGFYTRFPRNSINLFFKLITMRIQRAMLYLWPLTFPSNLAQLTVKHLYITRAIHFNFLKSTFEMLFEFDLAGKFFLFAWLLSEFNVLT